MFGSGLFQPSLFGSDLKPKSAEENSPNTTVATRLGTEEEEEVYSQWSQLHRFKDGKWELICKSYAKLLRHKVTKGIRFMFRQEGTIVANHYCIDHGPYCNLEKHNTGKDKCWAWTAPDSSDGETAWKMFALKFETVELAEVFKQEFDNAKASNRAAFKPTTAAEANSAQKGTETVARLNRESPHIHVASTTVYHDIFDDDDSLHASSHKTYDDDDDDIEIGINRVSKKIEKQVDSFVAKNHLDTRCTNKLKEASDEVASRVIAKDVPEHVKNPSAYTAKVLSGTIQEIAKESDNRENQNPWGGEAVNQNPWVGEAVEDKIEEPWPDDNQDTEVYAPPNREYTEKWYESGNGERPVNAEAESWEHHHCDECGAARWEGENPSWQNPEIPENTENDETGYDDTHDAGEAEYCQEDWQDDQGWNEGDW